jgi:putative NADH-flavin reductase
MKIAVVGSAGRAGRLVEQALARGHDVTAIARDPERMAVRHARLAVVGADALNRDELAAAADGADALISTLGAGSGRKNTDIYPRATRVQLDVMRERAIKRIVVISAAGAGPRAEQSFGNRIFMMPLLDRFFGPMFEDMRRMEALLGESSVSWVALRPFQLVDKPAVGTYRLDLKPLAHGRTLTYGDLASALLDSAARDDLHGRAAYVAN